MESQEVILDVELDTKNAKDDLMQITTLISDIGKVITVIGAVIVKAFSVVVQSVRSVEMSISQMSGALTIVCQKMNEIVMLQTQLQQGDWTGGLASIGDVCTILQTLITLTDDLTIAKMKSHAQDLIIDAWIVADGIKNFGLMAGQLIANAAAWVGEATAKTTNSVATWASVAATTAWNGISTAATAVTTAFGTAMTFLTSPIGIVILAVTALIAIIAALIANWDKIKAGVLEGCESMRNWLGKFDDYLQGIFAKDWSEQFGEFGHKLNDFFAVVKVVWDEVKKILNGIIDFIKNVFAGNWDAVWESIVNAFTGLWDGIVAVIKAPINLIKGLFKTSGGSSGGQSKSSGAVELSAPSIPLLAQGAVLPANKPFLAVVGDQKHGTNVEAPLDTIKQAMAEVLAGQGNGDVVINFTGDLAQLARVLKPVIDRENRRVGVSLAKGVV